MLRVNTARTILPSLIAALCAVTPPHSAGAVGLNGAQSLPGDAIALRSSARRAPDAAPALPADLPPGAHDLKPFTLKAVIRRYSPGRKASSMRQTISRTSDRVHLVAADNREWLFERNPVDPRRVSGLLVDHTARVILSHEESDLRNMLAINGWADVLLMGLDPASLSHLEPTDHTRTLAGVRFVKHVAKQKDAPVSHVWWNRDHVLAAAFVVSGAGESTSVSIEDLRPGVNAELLRHPSARFPSYKLMDLAKWLEGH